MVTKENTGKHHFLYLRYRGRVGGPYCTYIYRVFKKCVSIEKPCIKAYMDVNVKFSFMITIIACYYIILFRKNKVHSAL